MDFVISYVCLWSPSRAEPQRGHKALTMLSLNPLPPSDAVREQKNNISDDLLSSVLPQFKKYHPSGNLKFNNLSIFQSLTFRILMEKSLRNFS